MSIINGLIKGPMNVAEIKAKLQERMEIDLDKPYELVLCKCPSCATEMSTLSESYIVGQYCAACRDRHVPSHIPLEQQGMYLDKIIEMIGKNNERTKEEEAHQYSKQESESKRVTEVCCREDI